MLTDQASVGAPPLAAPQLSVGLGCEKGKDQDATSSISEHIVAMKQLLNSPTTMDNELAPEGEPCNGGDADAGGGAKPKFPCTPKVQKHLMAQAARTATMKRPAAAAEKETMKNLTTTPKKKTLKETKCSPLKCTSLPKNVLAFPGTERRGPLQYGTSVVYFSPGRFRLIPRKGIDKVDKAFSHKTSCPREAWRNLCKELHRLNPSV